MDPVHGCMEMRGVGLVTIFYASLRLARASRESVGEAGASSSPLDYAFHYHLGLLNDKRHLSSHAH